MATQTTTTVDFGAFPGKSDVSLAVTGQTGIIASSLVEAWIYPVATADHSADEHLVDPPRIVAGNVAAGTGFTIYAFSQPGTEVGAQNSDSPRVYGQWSVAWVWS